jgi:membrane protein
MTPSERSQDEPSRRQRLAVARDAIRGILARPDSLAGFLFKRLGEAHISREAEALSFSTALAVVPALALVFGVMTAFPAFDSIRESLQNTIVRNLVPDTGMRFSEGITSLVEAAGQLRLFGVIGLIFTAALLFLTIQSALNTIFRVIRPRPFIQRLLVFWAVMTIGPVLLGIGLSLMGLFARPQLVDGDVMPSPDPAAILLGILMPTLLTWVTLTFVFLIVPNRRLRRRDALLGAGVAAILLAMLRYFFAVVIGQMTTYQAVYGAIAAVPVFLLWIYLVWIVVLIGAVITAALPDWRYARVGYGLGVTGRLVLALEVLGRLAIAHRGGAGLSIEQLVKLLGAPDTILTAVFNDLRAGRFIAATEDGRWVLARDLDSTPLADLVHHFGLGLNIAMATDDPKFGEIGKRLNHYMRTAVESERTLLSVSLARIAAGPAEGQPRPE